MSIKFRNYTNQPGITNDYHRVRKFFINLGYAEFTYARWDWMITHSYLDKSVVAKIGIWEDNKEIVGIATLPGGNFVSYCGIWHDSKLDYAVIKPVATDPEYRKMGLGKTAVLEGIKRVGELGAKKVLVGFSQQFYYSIGLRPFATSTLWKKKK